MSRKSRGIPEINAGSMADIAFLLLVFFLVTTTMDIPTGLQVSLPPISNEPPPQTPQRERDVLKVLVNSRDQLLVEGELMDVRRLRQKTIDHLTNNGRNPTLASSSEKAIVSLKADRGTSYETYVDVYNELTAAYNIVRNDYSMENFGVPFYKLHPERDKDKIEQVKKKFPKQLSEAEPVDIGGS
jgi:biopolymer transport protein ExbD